MLSVRSAVNNASGEDQSEVCDSQFVRVESLRGWRSITVNGVELLRGL